MRTFSPKSSTWNVDALVHASRAIFRLQAGQDAVSRDCSRLQLLVAWPVSRGGTTSNPWAMSAATEAAGNHVSYRTLRARRPKGGKGQGCRGTVEDEERTRKDAEEVRAEEKDEAEEIEGGEGNEIVAGNVRQRGGEVRLRN